MRFPKYYTPAHWNWHRWQCYGTSSSLAQAKCPDGTLRSRIINRNIRMIKKDYDYSREKIDHKYRLDRQYHDFQYVNEVFQDLKRTLGDFEFSRLFEVILTDNGTEFSDPESIELSAINGERLSNVFFCDPNASWQKGSIEKNHEYIRYVLPKGTSFAGLTQEDCNLLASHIKTT